MRTNIVIDDRLMAEALRVTGLRTKRKVVELGLKTLLRLRRQADIRRLRGKITWEGDLDAARRDRGDPCRLQRLDRRLPGKADRGA